MSPEELFGQTFITIGAVPREDQIASISWTIHFMCCKQPIAIFTRRQRPSNPSMPVCCLRILALRFTTEKHRLIDGSKRWFLPVQTLLSQQHRKWEKPHRAALDLRAPPSPTP